jgi:transcription antitermination factor NusG
MQQWHVAKTKSGQDQIALENLKRQAFESFYPVAIVAKFYRGKIIESTEGYFPGYVFVRFSKQDDQWRIINSTRGVQKLLSFAENGLPSSVQDHEVERLQREEKQGELAQHLQIGDRVRMKNCSTFQPSGRVIATRGERIEFLMRLLGRDVKCIAAQSALYLVGRHIGRPVR